MSIAQAIAPHVPYLRRFARALAGSQQGGDAYALATLEAIVAEPTSFNRDLDVRVALYRVFLKVWNSIAVNGQTAAPAVDPEDGARRSLDALTPRPRVAFLLSAVEGFDVENVAATLDRPVDEARDLIDTAGREIAGQMATDVLIIEDEPIIAMDLESLVEGLGHRVVDVARTHREAVGAAGRHRPGLVLADIQLADGSSGLDAVNDILATFEVPVIFITAYPERLLTGARPEPAFLVTKPFRTDTIKAVISQALFFDRKSQTDTRAAAVG